MGKKEFSSFEVMKLLKVKRERLREWINQGFTVPMVAAKGAGTKAVFSIMDIYKIAVFKRLVDSGISRSRAAIWVKENPKINDEREIEDLVYILLVDQGGQWISYMEPGPWNIEEDLKEIPSWNVGVLVNFRAIKEELKNSILEI